MYYYLIEIGVVVSLASIVYKCYQKEIKRYNVKNNRKKRNNLHFFNDNYINDNVSVGYTKNINDLV